MIILIIKKTEIWINSSRTIILKKWHKDKQSAKNYMLKKACSNIPNLYIGFFILSFHNKFWKKVILPDINTSLLLYFDHKSLFLKSLLGRREAWEALGLSIEESIKRNAMFISHWSHRRLHSHVCLLTQVLSSPCFDLRFHIPTLSKVKRTTIHEFGYTCVET